MKGRRAQLQACQEKQGDLWRPGSKLYIRVPTALIYADGTQAHCVRFLSGACEFLRSELHGLRMYSTMLSLLRCSFTCQGISPMRIEASADLQEGPALVLTCLAQTHQEKHTSRSPKPRYTHSKFIAADVNVGHVNIICINHFDCSLLCVKSTGRQVNWLNSKLKPIGKQVTRMMSGAKRRAAGATSSSNAAAIAASPESPAKCVATSESIILQ